MKDDLGDDIAAIPSDHPLNSRIAYRMALAPLYEEEIIRLTEENKELRAEARVGK